MTARITRDSEGRVDTVTGMLVPIWSEGWEIDCCQPEAEAGGTWRVPISFSPGFSPWWQPETGASVDEDRDRYGSVELEVHRVRTTAEDEVSDGLAVFAAGPLRFRAPDDLIDGPQIGRLRVDAHSTAEIDPAQVTVAGTVVRVDLVPLRYELMSDELRGEMFHPVEQLAPIAASSTVDRNRIAPPAEDGDHIEYDLLVWLEGAHMPPPLAESEERAYRAQRGLRRLGPRR